VHVALPLAIARSDPKRKPVGLLRRVAGTTAVAAGSGLAVWACVQHFRSGDDASADQSTAESLLREGPYAYSRNPLYAGELLMWAGWSMLLRSRRVAVARGVLSGTMNVVVRREEQRLEDRFGESYRVYTRQVRRWI
jgi:protein-S-isoprenylcysteine O-methyltransferase Ste14